MEATVKDDFAHQQPKKPLEVFVLLLQRVVLGPANAPRRFQSINEVTCCCFHDYVDSLQGPLVGDLDGENSHIEAMLDFIENCVVQCTQ